MIERIRTMIVDDEAMSRTALRVRVQADPELALLEECSDGLSALEALRRLDPELLLLDIQMPRLDGFQLIENLEDRPCPVVVFVTAHDEYAVRAFDVAAVDYLLKPFDAARFRLAVARAKDRVYQLRSEGAADDAALAAPMAGENAAASGYADRFIVREQDRIFFLPVASVTRIEAASNYLRLHAASSVHVIRMRMADLERLLDPQTFARIHRSTIVRIDFIASMVPTTNGDHLVTLRDGAVVRLSRTYRDRLFATGVANA